MRRTVSIDWTPADRLAAIRSISEYLLDNDISEAEFISVAISTIFYITYEDAGRINKLAGALSYFVNVTKGNA